MDESAEFDKWWEKAPCHDSRYITAQEAWLAGRQSAFTEAWEAGHRSGLTKAVEILTNLQDDSQVLAEHFISTIEKARDAEK